MPKLTNELLARLGANPKPKGVATISTEDLMKELMERERTPLVFPLDIFPAELSPLIHALHDQLSIEKSYIGTTILGLVGAAVGNCIKGGLAKHLPTCAHGWYCLVGESSSGKTFVQKLLLGPMSKINADFFEQFKEEAQTTEGDKKQLWELEQRALIVQNITFEAFVRDKLRHNPKGLLMLYDEMTEWLDNMSQYQKGKSSPFVAYMLSSWSNTAYIMDRTGNKYVYIPAFRSGVSVLGGTQPGLVHNFFAGEMLDRGYTNRMVFAIPENGLGRLLVPSPHYVMDESVMTPWKRIIDKLFHDMPFRHNTPTTEAEFEPAAVNRIYAWQLRQMEAADTTQDLVLTRSVVGNYLGKINEYVARWAMLLALIRKALGNERLEQTLLVREVEAIAAIRLAEYYIASFGEVYKLTLQAQKVPQDVAQFVFLVKQKESLADISRRLKLCGKRDASPQAHTMAAKRKAMEILAKYPSLLKAEEVFGKAA